MGEVRGRVIRQGDGGAVAGATVLLVARGQRAKTEHELARATTASGGGFRLEWDDDDAPAGRPLLRIDVVDDAMLPVASERVTAGDTRDVVLRIPGEAPPGPSRRDDATIAQDAIERRRALDAVQDVLNTGRRAQLAGRIGGHRTRRRAGRDAFREFVRVLNDGEHEERPSRERLVGDGESVAAASDRAILASIAGRVDPAESHGLIVLEGGQAEALADRGPIPASEVGRVMQPGAVVLVRRDPFALECDTRGLLEDPCVQAIHDQHGPGGEGTGEAGEGDVPAEPTPGQPDEPGGPTEPTEPTEPATLPVLVGKLVDDVAPPEDPRIFRVADRAGLVEVEQGVQGFRLVSGPADVAAHYEFHHLQIAFEHVWQELFDAKATKAGSKLFAELVELGVDPKDFTDLSDLDELGDDALPDPTQLLDPPAAVIREFSISPAQWTLLHGIPDETQSPPFLSQLLVTLAGEITDLRLERDTEVAKLTQDLEKFKDLISISADVAASWKAAIRERYEPSIREARRSGDRLIEYADHRLEAPEDFEHFHTLLKELGNALREPYRFSVYAASRAERSVNFGLVTTYVQRWEPVSYQVGRLLKTIPLAPKEVRRFTRRVSVKHSRAEKEARTNVSSRRSESSDTSRSEAEIVQKAMAKTNFQLSAEGSINVAIASAKGSSAFGKDTAQESHEVKKAFREAVFKAAQEFRDERSVEINVSTSEEFSEEESGELTNPNDELPVTYLFYELQRRYKVSEKIRRLTPIVLVAQEFPQPHEIDDDWIVAHDWILRRSLLDDSFVPALDYLTTRIVGDEFALAEQYENLQQHRRLVDDIKTDVVTVKAQVGRRYEALQRSVAERADAIQAEDDEGFLSGGGEFLFGSNDKSPEALRVREDAARDAYERAAAQEKEALARLEREVTALVTQTEAYTSTLSDHLNRKAQVARLRVHVKQNIMYYMQSIWSHEPPDQRFFRLHDTRVPHFSGQLMYSIETDPDALPQPPAWKKPHKVVASCTLDTPLTHRSLEEVADLDNLLGFKGNYMMFPLKDSNVLTDFMMVPYLDAAAGLRDPDGRGNWTLSEFVDYVCCLRRHLSEEEFTRLRPALQETFAALASDPDGDGEEIVTPTDSVFIEALPGAHPILEDYKLMHRAVDVKKAQAEVRAAELENLRFARRLLTDELADPTIERTTLVQGVAAEVDVPVDDGDDG